MHTTLSIFFRKWTVNLYASCYFFQVMYTGPMFQVIVKFRKICFLNTHSQIQVYNTMLRQPLRDEYLCDLFEIFRSRNNFFSTTIHILVSAVVKLSRNTQIPSGLRLYRGLGKASEMPDSFYEEDSMGRRGYMEWGFMSTTSNESVARQVHDSCAFCLNLAVFCVIPFTRRSSTLAPRRTKK